MNELSNLPPSRTLRFAPSAWAKTRFLGELEDVEFGGFLITAVDDPLYIEDLRLIRQLSSASTIQFDEAVVEEFFAQMAAMGRPEESYARILFRSHASDEAESTAADEELFAKMFGRHDWSILLIHAKGRKCRLCCISTPVPARTSISM